MPRLQVCEGEVASCGECAGVVGAEDAGVVGQEGLVHVDGCGEVPGLSVCGGEVAARSEYVGVVGAEGVGEHVDGALEGQGGLRTLHSGEAIDRVVDNVNDAREVDAGLVGRIVCLSLLLFCDGSELVGHVEGVGPLGVVGVRLVHVDALEQVDDRALQIGEDLGLPRVVLAQDAPLEAVDAHVAPVLGQGAHGVGHKRPHRLAGDRLAVADPVKPGPGHARRGKKRQGRQLHTRRRMARGAVLVRVVFDPLCVELVENRCAGHAQGRVHSRRIGLAACTVDDLLKPILAQVGQVLVYRRIPVEPDGRSGLGQGHRQVPEGLGQTGRAVGLVQTSPLPDEIYRLGPRERPHRNEAPGTVARAGNGCRDKHAQTLAVGDQFFQVVKVLDVVEHDQPVPLTGVEPRHAPAGGNVRVALAVVDSHLDGQSRQTGHELVAAGGVHPRHQRPPGLLAFAGISGGQLRLAHTPHPTHNNRPTHRRRTHTIG